MSQARSVRSGIALLVFAASCADRASSTEPTIPDVEGAVSYVLSTDSGDGLIGVRADRIDRAAWVDDLRARTTIHLLLYGSPLETMGVEPGPVPPPVGCERPCGLLSPLRPLEATVEANGRAVAPGWVERAQVPEPLAAALVGSDRCGRRVCLRRLIDDIEVPSAVRVLWAAPESPETVLVGSEDGALFRLPLQGDLERVCLAIGESVTTAAARAGESESDRLWVAGVGWAGMVEISAATSTAACRVSLRVTLPGAGEAVAIAGSDPEEGGVDQRRLGPARRGAAVSLARRLDRRGRSPPAPLQRPGDTLARNEERRGRALGAGSRAGGLRVG